MPDPRAAAALLVVALACGDPGDTAPPRPPLMLPDHAPRDGPGVPLEDVLAAGAEPARLPSLLRRVGAPGDLERAVIPGGEVQTWRYPGLSFDLVREGGAERLVRVEVTGEGYRTADGLRVGMTREAVTGIRGQPSSREAGIEVYGAVAPGRPALSVVYSEDDVVEALVWTFPAGGAPP